MKRTLREIVFVGIGAGLGALGGLTLGTVLRRVSFDYVYLVEPYVKQGAAVGSLLCLWLLFVHEIFGPPSRPSLWQLVLISGSIIGSVTLITVLVGGSAIQIGWRLGPSSLGHPKRFMLCEDLIWGVKMGVYFSFLAAPFLSHFLRRTISLQSNHERDESAHDVGDSKT